MSSSLVLILVVAFASQLLALPTSDIQSRAAVGVEWTIQVQLAEPLAAHERLWISGDAGPLGNWLPNRAVPLIPTTSPRVWTGRVVFSTYTDVNYRYFIGAKDEYGQMQIYKWETHVEGRKINLGRISVQTSDTFGVVNSETKVNPGWLIKEYILELRFFKNPFKFYDVKDQNQRIFIKITPIDLDNGYKNIPPSTRVSITVARLRRGDSNFRVQPNNGIGYDNNDMVIFRIRTNDLDTIAYKVSINNVDGSVLGYDIVYPDDIEGSKGNIKKELTAEDDYIAGRMNISYILIKPLPGCFNQDLRTTFISYWPKGAPTLDAGHRGLGYSLQVPANKSAPVTENTVASFLATARLGGDIVEFDVHVTADGRVVIYHNYCLPVAKNPYIKPKSASDIKCILIKDYTHAELKTYRTYQIDSNSNVIEYKSYNEEPRVNWRQLELLDVVLEKVPDSVGMDIDIKHPQKLYNGELESIQTIDMNVYVNTILSVVERKGCGKMIFFSSQDLDILSMIGAKQNMYPIMPLGPSSDLFYSDPRTQSYNSLMNNAKTNDFLGIVPHAHVFFDSGQRNIRMAKDQMLKVFIWGDEISNSPSDYMFYKDLRPNGVIYDELNKFLRGDQESFFDQGEFPEYFQKQCHIYNK